MLDGDDTLWQTEQLYDKARAVAKRAISRAGLPGERWEMIQRHRDVENVKRFGVSRRRFPTSCIEAYKMVALESNRKASRFLSERIWRAASSVFDWQAPLVPGTHRVLRHISTAYDLVLFTKGDRAVQQSRIDDSGLRAYFSQIYIRAEKDTRQFRSILGQLKVAPGLSWSIGNSVRSDVNPAIAAGMNAIWVPAHVWEYEREKERLRSGAITTQKLTDVCDILASAAKVRG